MAQYTSHGFRTAAFFGVLAAMGYALQHPFSKPLASRMTNSISEALTILLATELVVGTVMIALLIARPDTAASVRRLYAEPKSLRRLGYQMLVGLASLLVYLFAIGRVDQVFLSVILNCFPFWFVLVGIILFKQEIGRDYVRSTELLLFCICLVFIVIFGYEELSNANIWYILLFSMIPVLYAVLYFLRVRFFEGYTPLVYLVAANLFNIAIIIPICIVVLFLSSSFQGIGRFAHLDFLLYALGALSSLGALYFLHRGGAVSESTAWVPAFMLFLTPAFTAMFSYITNKIFGIDLAFNMNYLWLVLVLSCCLLANRYLSEKRKLPPGVM